MEFLSESYEQFSLACGACDTVESAVHVLIGTDNSLCVIFAEKVIR
jgi:hypothetical protein